MDVGIEKAVSNLGVENGFLGNAALKILLPKEAQPIIDNIKLIPGGQDLVDKAVLSLNRSAEDAVKEATPIFVDAIKGMSFNDAKNILMGADNAATNYLQNTTSNALYTKFSPVVNNSLSKVGADKVWTDIGCRKSGYTVHF